MRTPLLLAAVLTLANAAKPVVVDDTAYLLFARHLAAHPGRPYDFPLFWYYEPQPANQILMPPVLPYWLGAGIALFGEDVVLLKLWLFPIAALLTFALRSLLRRFAGGDVRGPLAVLVLSPAILPQVNFMLDVPAVAFGLAALAALARAADRGSVALSVLAGVLAGLAMQTKYTQLVVPAALGLYGVCHRRWLEPLVAVATAAALFAGWERFVHERCGESHFLLHFRGTLAEGDPNATFLDRIQERFRFAWPLLTQFGGVALGFGVWGARAAGLPREVVAYAAALLAAALLTMAFAPYTWLNGDTVRVLGTDYDRPTVVFLAAGVGTLVAVVAIGFGFLGRLPSRRLWPWHWNRDSAFLFLWLGLEIAGTLGMSPFPAARRVIGVALVAGLIVARAMARWDRLDTAWRTPRWAAAFAVAWGVTLYAVDAWDAAAERTAVRRARALIPADPGGTVWTSGHWGWQYYADRAGMTQLVPNDWHPRAGDWVALPALPDKEGFYRPYPPLTEIPPWVKVRTVGEVVVDDFHAGQSVPNLYGGSYPLRCRRHPRLRVVVYEVVE